MTDFTSAAAVKAYLGTTASADDTLLATLVTSYSEWMRSIMNRAITTQAYQITRSGRGEKLMLMPDWPITAVTSLLINGAAVPQQTTFGGYGYRFSERAIALDVLCFARGNDNIQVGFTAGYAQVPVDIAQACVELVALHYKNRERVGIASKTLANETIAYIQRAMPDTVKQVLNEYRNVVPA